MRTLLFTFFLLLGAFCTAQELIGPDHVPSGTLASFEIVPEQEAAWHIVMPLGGTYQVDTGLSKLYFSSPECGQYTVIAGIVHDGSPQLLVRTFINGAEKELPIPLPPVSSLETWIKMQLPVLVKSKNLAAESRLVADCFEQIVRRIDDGTIKTPQNVQAQLQIALTGTLALASPTAVTEWMPFFAELSNRLETELGENVTDLTSVKKKLHNVSDALTATGQGEPMMKTSSQGIDTPNTQTPGTQNRVFRNLNAR